jgi:hypothetical protein
MYPCNLFIIVSHFLSLLYVPQTDTADNQPQIHLLYPRFWEGEMESVMTARIGEIEMEVYV